MLEPIPSNTGSPLRPGDRVRIAPAFQDTGDDAFQRIVIETPPNCTRVRIRTLIPGFLICPIEWIEAAKLEKLG